jgi:hypothetical protein
MPHKICLVVARCCADFSLFADLLRAQYLECADDSRKGRGVIGGYIGDHNSVNIQGAYSPKENWAVMADAVWGNKSSSSARTAVAIDYRRSRLLSASQ